MEPTYYLLLLTFLGFPIIGLLVSKHMAIERLTYYKVFIFAAFILQNIFFCFGLSLKGDYSDYIVFSLEYFIFCLTIFLLKAKKNFWTNFLKTLGNVVVSIGFITGLIGILLFIVISMDYETDKVFKFTSNGKNYETRRYSFGFATTSDTRYTFETYRTFDIFPIEYKIDETDFFGSETNLLINEPELKIEIIKKNGGEQIKFISTNGKEYIKHIN